VIDGEVIERRIDIINENMRYLRSVRGMDEKVFVSSFERVQASKHSLQEVIEACLDIANHILAAEGFPRAEEYMQLFVILAREGVIGDSLGVKLAQMAKFRNLLVHRYSRVSSGELYRILREDLVDVEEFVREILVFIEGR